MYSTVYSGYSGHSDIVATFPGTKYICFIIFRSDIVARKWWPKVATISEVHCITCSILRGGQMWLPRNPWATKVETFGRQLFFWYQPSATVIPCEIKESFLCTHRVQVP